MKNHPKVARFSRWLYKKIKITVSKQMQARICLAKLFFIKCYNLKKKFKSLPRRDANFEIIIVKKNHSRNF